MNNRQLKILDMVMDTDQINVSELANRLEVSKVTIRQDLKHLEEEGMLKRTHGGAKPLSDDDIMKRMTFNYKTKIAIAREAATLIEDGETLLMESGSTNALIAKELTKKDDISIITNSTFIGRYIRGNKNVNITLLGGDYQHEAEVLVGPLTKLCLQQIHVEKAFVGVDGFSPEAGFTNINLMRAEVIKSMGRRANLVVIVTDSSKFNNVGVAPVFRPEEVDILITDKNIPEKQFKLLEKCGIDIKLV